MTEWKVVSNKVSLLTYPFSIGYNIVITLTTISLITFLFKLILTEDIEFTILHYLKEGKTLRYNNIGLKTKYYQPEGGICAFKGGVDKREEEAWDNGTYLIGVYPELCSLYLKSDGKLNIKLKDKRK